MRLNKAPKEKLKSHPRKVKFKDEWDSVVTNEVGGSRVRDNNMSSRKKKVSLFNDEFIRRFDEMFAETYEQAKKRGSLEPSQSPNTTCESNHCKEEEKPTITTPLSKNKPEIDDIEEIEVTAEEGELWVESLVPSLQKIEDEEIIVQVEENYIDESQLILIEGRVDEQESSTNVADLDNISTEEESDVRAELKIDNVEHIDFMGVDRFDVHPNFMLLDFFNKLRRIALQYGLKFEKFCFVRRIKRRRYSKYLFSWEGRTELSHVKFRWKNGKYSKYLFNWHGRFQVPKPCPNAKQKGIGIALSLLEGATFGSQSLDMSTIANEVYDILNAIGMGDYEEMIVIPRSLISCESRSKSRIRQNWGSDSQIGFWKGWRALAT
ncbi:hypothetical protein LguiA_017713 [Lonicera macranthoides]